MAISVVGSGGVVTSTTGTLTLTKPGGTVSTDVMIATIKDDVDGGVTAPGSWQLIASQGDVGQGTTSIFWAFAAETNLAFTVNGTTAMGCIMAYSGCNQTTPIGASATSSAAGGGSPFTWTAPSVTSTLDNSFRVVGFGYVDFSIGSAPALSQTGTTLRFTGTALDAGFARVGVTGGDVNISPPGATGTTSCTATGGIPSGGTQQAVAFILQPIPISFEENAFFKQLHISKYENRVNIQSVFMWSDTDTPLLVAPPSPSDEGGGFVYLPGIPRISIRIG